ncbi:death-associated protein kinase 1 [Amia ocellicauda]|uniref:death-associated protein kinase 1 n=1 Tax=Amia ocellicauda TaxID=2972642 RepID=UPI003463B728
MSAEQFLTIVQTQPPEDIQLYLKEHFVDTNYCDQFSNTALHYAACRRSREVVALLVETGGQVLKENAEGLTPIHFAAFGGNKGVLQYLLVKAPQAVNHRGLKNLSSPLHEAVSGKTVQAVEFLLSQGADCNLQNQDGNTPLHLAASQRSKCICSLLLQSGANVLLKNKKGDTCLHCAAATGALSICQMLVQKGASIQARNKNGETAVFSAVRSAGASPGDSGSELISWLIEESGPFLTYRNKDELTVLDVARQKHLPSKTEVLIKDRMKELQIQSLLKESKVVDSRRVVKLFICGNSGVGKTTLAKTLKQQEGVWSRLQRWFNRPPSPPSTRGVAITRSDLAAGRVVVWDFAGQMEYYFTHSLLLSANSGNVLYCIVFNLEQIQCAKGGTHCEALGQVLYWLRFLNSSWGCSVPHRAKVLLIGSHKDKLEMENKDEIVTHFFDIVRCHVKELQVNLDIDTAVISMNCKSPSDLQPLRQRLEECVEQLAQDTASPFPEICGEVMDEIYNIRVRDCVKYLSLEDFVTSVRSVAENVSAETLRMAVEYLHNISELLFFPSVSVDGGALSAESGSGAGLVILDVQWLCQDIFGKFGHFALSTLPLQQEKWTTAEIAAVLKLDRSPETVVRLLEMLELVFSDREGEYIVPAWLRKGKPANIWDREEGFNVYCGVSYRWRGNLGLFSQAFFSQLQMRLMKLFIHTAGECASAERFVVWAGGIKCVDVSEALVQLSANRRSVNVAVRGHRPQTHRGRARDTQQKCCDLQEMISRQVECLLKDLMMDHEWERLYLSPRDILAKMDASDDDITAYTTEEILESERSGTNLYSKLRGWEECLCDVLLAGYDKTILQGVKWDATIQWLTADKIEGLCALLDPVHPLGHDWKGLMERLESCTYEHIAALTAQSEQTRASPTLLLLQKNRRITLRSLHSALQQINREDCMSVIKSMFDSLL